MNFNEATILKALVDSTDAIVVAADTKGRVLFVNEAFTRVMGFTPDEAIGRSVWSFRVPEEQAESKARFRENTARFEGRRAETRWIARDGSERILNWSIRRLTSESGARQMVVATAIDVTAERDSERRSTWFHQMLEQAEEAVIMIGPDRTIRFVNQAAIDIYGYSEDEFIGLNNAALTPESEREAIDAFTVRLKETLAPQEIETWRRRADGSIIPVHIKAAPLRDPDGELYGIVGVSYDMTEQLALQARERVATDRARMLARIVENLPEPVFHVREDGIIDYANEAVRDVYGYRAEEMLGHPMAMVRPADRTRSMGEFLDHVSHTGDPSVIETQALHKMGHRIDVELRVTRFEGERGENRGFVGLARDIAERKRIEEELRERADTDRLTGLANRHALDVAGDAEFRRARRYCHHLSVIVCDLDHFKSVNDTYGHAGGDAALRRFAEIMNASLRRPTDVLARMGGEEFCLLLPETAQEGAARVAERIRQSAAQMVIEAGERAFSLTVSLGVSQVVGRDRTIGDAIERADAALYMAKQQGRNRVETYPWEPQQKIELVSG